MARFIPICLALLALSVCMPGLAEGEIPLDLIECFHSDSSGSLLWMGPMSPGDIDGDGFSELFVAEALGAFRLLVFSGGNPHDIMPDMVIESWGGKHAWIPDLNGDGIDDLAFRSKPVDSFEFVEVWFGGPGFLNKTEADLIYTSVEAPTSSSYGQTISSGDINGDDQNDLVIGGPYIDLPILGSFWVYYGGDLLDTILDERINIYYTHQGYNDFYSGAGLGDINGDGLHDLAWGGIPGTGKPGYVAIVFGNSPLDSLPDLTIWSPNWELGDPNGFGRHIWPLGDINRDGFDDFAVGGDYRPYLFFGGDPFDTIPLLLGDTTIETTRGSKVSVVGDINDDGWDDLGVGDPSYAMGWGLVNVYYGYRDFDPTPDLTFFGNDAWPTVGYMYGNYLGPAGDFNGDGVDDLVITSETFFSGMPDDGNVYVYAGDSNLPTPADEIRDDGSLPHVFNILKQNYPNPFNDKTTIRYDLWGNYERPVELVVYNLLGERVRTVISGRQHGGLHVADWNGTDDKGNAAPSGIYFYVLNADNQRIVKKMLFLK